MTKTKLISSLGSAVAISLLSAPLVQASENPFAMQNVTNATQLAESMEKGTEGNVAKESVEGKPRKVAAAKKWKRIKKASAVKQNAAIK